MANMWSLLFKKPALFCADGKFRWFLVANVPKLSELYWPPIWAIQTHVQTALANYLRGRLPELPYYRSVHSSLINSHILFYNVLMAFYCFLCK